MFKYIYAFIDKIKSKLSQKGQGMVEYALILAFVAAIAAIALKSDGGLGLAISNAFTTVANKISPSSTGSTESTGP